MTHSNPADPDPSDSPDLDAGGSPTGAQTPDSHSTSLQSDSARTGQSPTRSSSKTAVYVVLAVVVLFALLMVIGVVFGVI